MHGGLATIVGVALIVAPGCGYTTTRVRLLDPTRVGVQYRAAGKVVKVIPRGSKTVPPRELLMARKAGGSVLRALVERRGGRLTLRCEDGCPARPLLPAHGTIVSLGPVRQYFSKLGSGPIRPLKKLLLIPEIAMDGGIARQSGAPLVRGFVEVELTTSWDNVDQVVEMRSQLPWGVLGPGLGSFFGGLGAGLGGAIGGNKGVMGVGLGILGVGAALIGWALATTHKPTVVYRRDRRRASR